MKILKYIFSFFTIVLFANCSTQKKIIDLSKFKKAQTKIEYEKIDSSKLISRTNSQLVTVSFFETFNDSVEVYLNNKNIWKGNIYDKNNPYSSSGWSGIQVNVSLSKHTNSVLILLINKKEFIDFEVTSEFPNYIIQRYNEVWYIRYQKSFTQLK